MNVPQSADVSARDYPRQLLTRIRASGSEQGLEVYMQSARRKGIVRVVDIATHVFQGAEVVYCSGTAASDDSGMFKLAVFTDSLALIAVGAASQEDASSDDIAVSVVSRSQLSELLVTDAPSFLIEHYGESVGAVQMRVRFAPDIESDLPLNGRPSQVSQRELEKLLPALAADLISGRPMPKAREA